MPQRRTLSLWLYLCLLWHLPNRSSSWCRLLLPWRRLGQLIQLQASKLKLDACLPLCLRLELRQRLHRTGPASQLFRRARHRVITAPFKRIFPEAQGLIRRIRWPHRSSRWPRHRRDPRLPTTERPPLNTLWLHMFRRYLAARSSSRSCPVLRLHRHPIKSV